MRWGTIGAGAAMVSSAASSAGLPSMILQPPAPVTPPLGLAPQAPAGINPQLFQRAKAALDQHRIRYRDHMGIVDFGLASAQPRFHVVDIRSGAVESYTVTHGKGSDPAHCGYLEQFSNAAGSEATSNGTYTTDEYYYGKHGLSLKLNGLDWSNNNAMNRAIVIHSAWYAEPNNIAEHGKLGRSQGCFAFSRHDQWLVMQKLAGGRMIFADKMA
ncbi:murein L,D-transpeptidase catalytic domain family protein [Sphingomonas sabuli]|uniref:murein L,D-transpeptidase catalytic domain family protein n=1 Tax=Sphingomonas sabuli TaxID=2764186 RepID=UPI001FE7BC2B|nr:murein L,D-transpeptidase catalytic domain family protein [Sphingomonas sabuli]